MLSEKELIDYNTRKHDQIATVEGDESYDARHVEIFNATEQRRLTLALDKALALRQTQNRRILDFGCGTGNLTGKLLAPGREVWAADVSQGMCDLVKRRFAAAHQKGELKTVPLNGDFPLPFPDRHFGFAATYSVLHHVPNYELAVRELVRVLDHGAVLYIDHEASDDFWSESLGFRLYRLLRRPYWGLPRLLRRLTGLTAAERATDSGLQGIADLPEEGDIHIFAHDHIEWKVIEQITMAGGISRVPTKDYLACDEVSRFPIRHWICRGFGNDTGLFIGVKKADACAPTGALECQSSSLEG